MHPYERVEKLYFSLIYLSMKNPISHRCAFDQNANFEFQKCTDPLIYIFFVLNSSLYSEKIYFFSINSLLYILEIFKKK